jgi:hypothetical protein
MVSAVERRRRRFWKPKSVYEHPDWPKKVAHVKRALPDFDALPAPIRAAMRDAHHDFASIEMLQLWERASHAMPEQQAIDYLIKAIRHGDQALDQKDRQDDRQWSQGSSSIR